MAKATMTVRQKVLDYLTRHGEVSDADGRSTAVLTEALGLSLQKAGTVSATLTALASEGLIERELSHRRCYSIRLAGQATYSNPLDDSPVEIDYDQLAKAMLQRAVESMAEVDELRAEIERLKRQLEITNDRLASADQRAVQTLLRGAQR